MPLFEYECKDCGERFEALIIGSHKPVCPSCRSERLEKLASVFGVSGNAYSGRSSRSDSGCSTGGG
jgi:putative FmdB family regulatory protein